MSYFSVMVPFLVMIFTVHNKKSYMYVRVEFCENSSFSKIGQKSLWSKGYNPWFWPILSKKWISIKLYQNKVVVSLIILIKYFHSKMYQLWEITTWKYTQWTVILTIYCKYRLSNFNELFLSNDTVFDGEIYCT